MGMTCHHGICGKCHGVMKLVWGVLLLVNAFVWPRWLGVDGWVSFVAVLMVLVGLVKLMKPSCGHCESEMPMKKKR
ncbi:MAG: hypothetical protein Q8Q01_01365 [archaeon]|nr:hypothetical protein [archaeon]